MHVILLALHLKREVCCPANACPQCPALSALPTPTVGVVQCARYFLRYSTLVWLVQAWLGGEGMF